MKQMIRTFRASAVTLLLAVSLAACGSATSDTTTGAPGSSPAAAVATSTAQSQPAAQSSAPAATTSSQTNAGTTAKLNLNTVTEDELLATIPGFSTRMVHEFEEYRPYVSITQFRKEIGKYVDDAQVAAYEQYVYVPIDVDESDAATLQQIPGVDAALADALIAGRPYGSNAAFLTKLGESLTPEQIAVAGAYLAAE